MSNIFLVTGASKGLGRSIAISLANSGKTVFALSRTSKELDDLSVKLKSKSANSRIICCDLGNEEDILKAVSEIQLHCNHLTGIVHNAGTIAPIEKMLDVSRANWERALNVNLIGVQHLTQSLNCLLYTSPSPRDS